MAFFQNFILIFKFRIVFYNLYKLTMSLVLLLHYSKQHIKYKQLM
jgi:hypothetical protein